MKTDFVPLQALKRSKEKTYWRSLTELNHPGAGPDDEPGAEPEEANRRQFLSLMGASLALAGAASCTRQPPEQIVPYVDPPEKAVPGRPTFYATAVPDATGAEGVVVETHLGRPTKVEGNPNHPASRGATSVRSQASVLDLYDPDRAKHLTHLGQGRTWDAFLLELRRTLDSLGEQGGAGLRVLTGAVTSPVLAAQIDALLEKYPRAKWHSYDPAGQHSLREGSRLAFGRYLNTYYRLDRSDVVVALDSDFLGCGESGTHMAHDFAQRRKRGGRLDMNRLYAVESGMTPTGGKADHRLSMRWDEVERLARNLAADLGVPGVTAGPEGGHRRWIATVAQDLQEHRGASVIIPGLCQSPAVHFLAHAMNAALDNDSATVIHTDPVEWRPKNQLDSLAELVGAMNAGDVELLVILGGNPVYNAPADLEFASALGKVDTAVYCGLHQNATAASSHWNVPASHCFEEWGDVRAYDGSISILQPLTMPLYETVSPLTVVDGMLRYPARSSYEIVRDFWMAQHTGGDFEPWWRKSVHDGVVAGSALPEVSAEVVGDLSALETPSAGEGLEVVFRPDPYLYDGAPANNNWLHELPRPMTKLSWDNAVLISPATAARLDVETGRVVKLRDDRREVEGAVWVSPGHPDDSITVHLGFGQRHRDATSGVAGFDAYKIRSSQGFWSSGSLALEVTSRTYPLATTQLHQQMEGRRLVIENTVAGYREDPDFVHETQEPVGKNETLYPQWQYNEHAWGMSIDLTACVNCNACVVACQAENNIPVVGKEQVLTSREMHWLRIDTYFSGEPENPTASYQPVPCMQCENAPCELVCPVQATNHSSDGLNDMVYNRCVGTRYCSNNCPYKVRRFNFLEFQDWVTESLKLQRNPNVTVRSRGVMEKCTYCVQRIRAAEIEAKTEDREIRDGDIVTACQQACPTQAIVFGDINNPQSQVSKLKAENLDYALLAELNTRPRTTYLAELRNPNPAIESRPNRSGGDHTD